MKSRMTLVLAVAAAVAVIFFAFSACESTELLQERELRLLSVKIGDLNVTAIPQPISSDDWDDEEIEVAGADFGLIIVKNTGTEDKRITARATEGATITWGMVKGGNRPAKFDDLRMLATFDLDDFFYFKVEGSEIKNGVESETTKYYRFYPNEASPVKELAAIAIAGRDTSKIPSNAASLQTLLSSIASENFRGQIDITRKEATDGALVAAEPQDATASIRYGVAPSIGTAATFSEDSFVNTRVVVVQDEQEKDHSQAHGTLTFTDGNVLIVEVTAQDDSKYFYGFLVTAGRMATIASLQFDEVEVTNKGTQHAQWNSVLTGGYASADQQPGGFNISIELDDPDGLAEYAIIPNAGDPAYSTNPQIHFNDKQTLAIRIRSARYNLGLVTTTSDTRYYKVQVNLLAANFTKHPKSTAYEVLSHTYQPTVAPGEDYNGRILIDAQGTRTLDRAIEPLSFEVDRDQTGFTYQWYTANSWYGGYGFDKDGRIIADPHAIEDTYHPAVAHLDEKNNISLHNGGNEFYRLPYAGFPIDDATQATFTPIIDASRRPFLPGFSNQTQYYWVKITDSQGCEVISDRAAIVTEWGYVWDMGKPTTTKVTKKHHIVDTHAYMDDTGETYGFMDNPRNVTPFKAGNHGDQYYIPLTFPDDFNVMDYSMVTCQALFYLADGREWIQNWTQGDFGFADADKGKLVLWYNLTNDNGTRGLASSGNDPEKSGLHVKPGHLIVQPAGTSPIKQMPPFKPDGQPDKEAIEADGKTAQGWFTPYIKIVELRFEGPARTPAP